MNIYSLMNSAFSIIIFSCIIVFGVITTASMMNPYDDSQVGKIIYEERNHICPPEYEREALMKEAMQQCLSDNMSSELCTAMISQSVCYTELRVILVKDVDYGQDIETVNCSTSPGKCRQIKQNFEPKID